MTSLDAAPPLRFDRVELRPRERKLLVDGKEAGLGARAFDVMLALVERRDRLVPKSELLDVVWPDTIVEENNLQVQISTLRKVLGPSAITTIPGRGYRFTLPPKDDVPAPAEANVTAAIPVGRTNVAAAVETLIGRGADVQAVGELLASHRLVTVLGPGGIGKTRVALEVARSEVDKHADGTWWVDLASISSPEQVASAIAGAVRLQLGEGDVAAKLAASLAQLDLLLVLDNCEHLVTEVARVTQIALERAPKITILATSQVALKLAGEHLYRLGTLETPNVDADLTTARRHAAIALLERRAQAADRRFMLTDANIGTAISVCRALEGVALAIEMAAARVPAMGLTSVCARLDDRFRMLASSNRVAQGRHQTLLATLDWSHALLSGEEQAVLRRIGVFAGSFEVDAAKALAQDASLDEWAVLDALAGLVDKSLLQIEQLEPPRYRLLETTRLYALDRLEDANETAGLRARHASVMATIAARILADGAVLPDAQWAALYTADYQDVEAAFTFAVANRNHGEAAVTAQALRQLDVHRGNVSGMRARMRALFALTSDAPPDTVARLWDGVMPNDQIAIDAIARLDVARNRVAAWRAHDDAHRLCAALCGLADEFARAGDFENARQALRDAEALERPGWSPRMRLVLSQERGAVAMYGKDAEGYRFHRREVLRLAEQAGATRIATSARLGLGDAALLAQDYEEAATLCRDVVEELRALNRPFSRGIALENLSNALVHLGDLDGASVAAAESLPIMRQNEAGADVFNILALIAVRCGLPESAARMLGHVDAWVATSQYDLAPNEARTADEAGREIDAAIGAEAHARLRKQGATMSDDEADRLAAELFTVSRKGTKS